MFLTRVGLYLIINCHPTDKILTIIINNCNTLILYAPYATEGLAITQGNGHGQLVLSWH